MYRASFIFCFSFLQWQWHLRVIFYTLAFKWSGERTVEMGYFIIEIKSRGWVLKWGKVWIEYLVDDLIFYMGRIFFRVSMYHCHLVGRHLLLQLVDQSQIFISVLWHWSVLTILGFQIKKQIFSFMSWQIFSSISTFSLLQNQVLIFTFQSKKVLGLYKI